MKKLFLVTLTAVALSSCQNQETKVAEQEPSALNGSWKLISNKIITKGDTVHAFPVKDQVMIKILNGTHFAFFKHDINKGVGENAVYSSGSGTYSYKDKKYTERLEYCDAREWENHDFSFTLTFKNDTLIQTGIEKIDSLNVNREIIETYVKM